MVPIAREMAWEAAHTFTRRIAQELAATDPERYVTAAELAKRSGKLFIDYLRNGRGTTAIGAYSPRARKGFPSPRRSPGETSRRGCARTP
jgi:bifunctional non-homologous end joining protein LigD